MYLQIDRNSLSSVKSLILAFFTGGRREFISLQNVLQFATGSTEEPVLGFTLHPSIEFVEVKQGSSFLPTANTCINTMQLPRPSLLIDLPPTEELFKLYDYAFLNTYFGLY